MSLHKLISRKALTLIELLLAASLMGLIMVTAASIEVDIRNYYFASDREAQLQLRLSSTLEHMAKRIHTAVGDVNNVPVESYSDNRGIMIWVDTPANPGVRDHRIGYRHEGNLLRFCNNVANPGNPALDTWENIAVNILTTDFAQPVNTWGLVIDYDPVVANGRINVLTITLRNRFNPANTVSLDNPQVELTTYLHMPSVSVN